MEHLSSENIMIFLLAALSGLNLFLGYFGRRKPKVIEVEHVDYSRTARERIGRLG
ncbi:hypothetical protein D3C72_1000020 [compost metagenome]